MQTLNKMIRKVAPQSGLGIAARRIGDRENPDRQNYHELSQRRRNPFAKVNCAALPDNLIESNSSDMKKGLSPGPRN